MSRKLIDLIGQRFGRLIVLYRDKETENEKGNKTTFWKCKCDCGNEISLPSGSLRGGRTNSCGCLAEDVRHNKKNDLTGRKFGRLTALYENKDDPRKEKYRFSIWHCVCDCGNECDVFGTSLTQGKTKSCGCLQKDTVSKMFTKDIRKFDEDGNITEKFCPMCKKWRSIDNYYKNNYSIDGYNSTCKICCKYRLQERYDFYKNNAKRRKLDFDLDIDQFDDITQQSCVYCGNYNGEYNQIMFSGIDRINSDEGYVNGNIVPCCDTCNKMKGVLTVDQWLNHMQSVLKYYKKEIGD
ncbi:MAG: hypothetical protein PUE12_17865 [Oscillospiraceae bacterium]|nr:hypothetical protein [Oscillospiraceae bacterium]